MQADSNRTREDGFQIEERRRELKMGERQGGRGRCVLQDETR